MFANHFISMNLLYTNNRHLLPIRRVGPSNIYLWLQLQVSLPSAHPIHDILYMNTVTLLLGLSLSISGYITQNCIVQKMIDSQKLNHTIRVAHWWWVCLMRPNLLSNECNKLTLTWVALWSQLCAAHLIEAHVEREPQRIKSPEWY